LPDQLVVSLQVAKFQSDIKVVHLLQGVHDVEGRISSDKLVEIFALAAGIVNNLPRVTVTRVSQYHPFILLACGGLPNLVPQLQLVMYLSRSFNRVG
jgi:hypothetical protein